MSDDDATISKLRHPTMRPADCPLCADVGLILDKLLDALDVREAKTTEDLVRMGHVFEGIASWWGHRAFQMTGGDPGPILETLRNMLAQNGIDARLMGFESIPPTRH